MFKDLLALDVVHNFLLNDPRILERLKHFLDNPDEYELLQKRAEEVYAQLRTV